MSESEQPAPREVRVENPVVVKVHDAIEKPWQKPENAEYSEIRKQLEKRMAWHGMGVAKHFIQTIDGAADIFFKDKKFMRGVLKVINRPAGVWLGATAAAVDIVYNAATWGLRKIIPLPKDIAKRTVVYGSYAVAGATGAAGVAFKTLDIQRNIFLNLMVPGRALKKLSQSEGYQKGMQKIREAGESAFLAPEIAVMKMKNQNKVDVITQKIINPIK